MPHCRESLLVELCGLPGVGKTHIAGTLLEDCGRYGLTVHAADASVSAAVGAPIRVPRKVLLAAEQVLVHPVLSTRAARMVAGSRQPTWRDVLSHNLGWLMTQRLLARAQRRSGVHVFSEGVVQAWWSMGLRGDGDLVVESVGDPRFGVVLPDLLVVVQAPLDVVGRRLAARASRHSRTQSLTLDDQRSELARGQGLLAALVNQWEDGAAGHPVKVLHVDNPGISADGSARADLTHVVERVLGLMLTAHHGPTSEASSA